MERNTAGIRNINPSSGVQVSERDQGPAIKTYLPRGSQLGANTWSLRQAAWASSPAGGRNPSSPGGTKSPLARAGSPRLSLWERR